jgi:hypothetical protein
MRGVCLYARAPQRYSPLVTIILPVTAAVIVVHPVEFNRIQLNYLQQVTALRTGNPHADVRVTANPDSRIARRTHCYGHLLPPSDPNPGHNALAILFLDQVVMIVPPLCAKYVAPKMQKACQAPRERANIATERRSDCQSPTTVARWLCGRFDTGRPFCHSFYLHASTSFAHSCIRIHSVNG